MLHRTRKLPEGLAIATQSAEFWRRLAPELTISDAQPDGPVARSKDQSSAERLKLVNDGYLHLKFPQFSPDLPRIEKVMSRIVNAGLPAAFIGVYDEVWSLIARLNTVIDGMFDQQAAMVPTFWANHSDIPTGLAACRNRPANGIFRDGTPKNLTVWLPLTNATPETGCVYVVPARQDRAYGKSNSSRADASLPSIRAVPANAGDIIIWNGEIYHWMSRPEEPTRANPLLSLTWEFQSRDAAPLDGLFVDSYPHVPFESRLSLLAHQMPRHGAEMSGSPVWRAVQQTLANRFPIRAAG